MTEYRVSGVVAEGAERGIILSDGASFTLPTGRRSSYDGFVLERRDTEHGFCAIKILDGVRFEDAGEIEHVTVEPASLIAEYEHGLVAVFTLESTSRSATLQIQTSRPASGAIRFDVRHAYDAIPFHKIYELEPLNVPHGQGFSVSFRKSSEGDQRFDIEQELRFACYGAELSLERTESWPHVDDPFDAARGQSAGHHAYEPIRFSGCETIVVTTKKSVKPLRADRIEDETVDRRSAATRAAASQLRGSLLGVGTSPRILAGFPWFFQEWSRDAAISIGGLRQVLDPATRVSVLLRLARSLASSEESIQSDTSSLRSADATGLVFLRLSEEKLDAKTRKSVAKLLASALEADEARMTDGLVHNGALETWMDTGNGFRAGACVEIQALYARMLAYAHELTGDQAYSERLGAFIDAVRSRLIGPDGRVVDHIDENGIAAAHVTPNQFLAYAFYPGLFEEGTWRWSFDYALDALTFTDAPGRIASLEPTSPLYCPFHTGADNRSYHRGDSWLFVNHLAALALARLDRNAYRERIEAIIAASLVDCFERGAFCAFSEVSSAERQDSNGCWAQTWSASTFLELMGELDR